ncbi:hypothetical protein [Streptomyces mirabilis]|uniref:hypothetical protein n=1 Tax=Streptomyces mirabilis TaxID=68239 RepID=UPI0036E9E0ED
MEDTAPLRQAVLAWLEQARDLPSIPQAITDVALSTQPEFDAVINAVVGAAPKSEHRDLYGKADGDWAPRWSTLLGGSGLGDATRLVAQGATVPVEEVADSFVAFCTAPAPAVEDWLLLTGDLPDLAPLLDAAAAGTGRERAVDEPLRAFFRATPPQDRDRL